MNRQSYLAEIERLDLSTSHFRAETVVDSVATQGTLDHRSSTDFNTEATNG